MLCIDSLSSDERKKAFWERECLCIVREKAALQRSEDELSMAKRSLTLDNERAKAETEYRQLSHIPGIIETCYKKSYKMAFLSFTTIVKTKGHESDDVELMISYV